MPVRVLAAHAASPVRTMRKMASTGAFPRPGVLTMPLLCCRLHPGR